MNRRTFIKRGLVGGGLLALSGIAAWPTAQVFAPADLRHMSARAFQIFCAIAARIVPTAKDPREIAMRADASMIDMDKESIAEFEDLLALFDNGLVGLLDGHVRPFTRLSAEAQDVALEAWRDSSITLRRSGYQALRKLALSMYYSGDEEQRAAGYMGPRRIPGLSYDDSTAGVKT